MKQCTDQHIGSPMPKHRKKINDKWLTIITDIVAHKPYHSMSEIRQNTLITYQTVSLMRNGCVEETADPSGSHTCNGLPKVLPIPFDVSMDRMISVSGKTRNTTYSTTRDSYQSAIWSHGLEPLLIDLIHHRMSLNHSMSLEDKI